MGDDNLSSGWNDQLRQRLNQPTSALESVLSGSLRSACCSFAGQDRSLGGDARRLFQEQALWDETKHLGWIQKEPGLLAGRPVRSSPSNQLADLANSVSRPILQYGRWHGRRSLSSWVEQRRRCTGFTHSLSSTSKLNTCPNYEKDKTAMEQMEP